MRCGCRRTVAGLEVRARAMHSARWQLASNALTSCVASARTLFICVGSSVPSPFVAASASTSTAIRQRSLCWQASACFCCDGQAASHLHVCCWVVSRAFSTSQSMTPPRCACTAAACFRAACAVSMASASGPALSADRHVCLCSSALARIAVGASRLGPVHLVVIIAGMLCFGWMSIIWAQCVAEGSCPGSLATIIVTTRDCHKTGLAWAMSVLVLAVPAMCVGFVAALLFGCAATISTQLWVSVQVRLSTHLFFFVVDGSDCIPLDASLCPLLSCCPCASPCPLSRCVELMLLLSLLICWSFVG